MVVVDTCECMQKVQSGQPSKTDKASPLSSTVVTNKYRRSKSELSELKKTRRKSESDKGHYRLRQVQGMTFDPQPT